MSSSRPSSSTPGAKHRSRWALAQDGSSWIASEALRELAERFAYCIYVWWRGTGLNGENAAAATTTAVAHWLKSPPPSSAQEKAPRLREWIPARLTELSARERESADNAGVQLDLSAAEKRFGIEPSGEANAVFQRRWALTVLELAASQLQAEYAARGEASFFDELRAFAGFTQSGEEAYAEGAKRTDRSVGAMRKAVFDFRTRHGELIREVVADTVADAADVDSELTSLLVACDAGVEDDAVAPLPIVLAGAEPGELFARAMNSVWMSSAGARGWSPPTVNEVARLFPNFEVLSMLGHGGMGAVYRARQTSLDRLVAIKLLPLEISVDPEFAARFRREARAMARLNHPHIVSVFDFGQTSEGHLFFVMEFVEGANLHELIHRRDPLPPASALAYLAQVCEALAYAHGKGIVHRDIKPANVMIDGDGRAKVADFGLARLADATGGELWGTTMTGVVLGTPDYMAPEQKRGGEVDHRADIYALGVMLYEALCRETPQGAFILPSQRCGLDKRLDGIVARALATEPEARFSSASEMRAALESVRPAVAKAQEKRGRPGWSQLFLGLAAAAILAGAVLLFRSRTSPKADSRALANEPSPLATASIDTPFVNTLGMRFVPVPIAGGPGDAKRVLFSVWETRVGDYAAFAHDTKQPALPIGFSQELSDPIVCVTWDEAHAFCGWLTVRERKAGRLSREVYRLPTDHEWSCAVGIGGQEDPAEVPAKKDRQIVDVFPWGDAWPPPTKAGNYCGEENRAEITAGHPWMKGFMSGYTDGAERTRPVGSYSANGFGLYDLGGNVWEWCGDWYDARQSGRVARGGSWNDYPKEMLLSSRRLGTPPHTRYDGYGFRMVLAAE